MSNAVKKCPKCFGTGVEPDHVAIGLECWKKRADACLSGAIVAKRMGIDPSHLSYLESGKRSWSPELLEKFNQAVKP